MSQTAYSFYLSAPFAGVLGDYRSDYDIRSYVSEEATAGLPFGIAVCRGTGDQQCKLLVDANSKIIGLTVHQHAVEPYYLPTSPTTSGVAPKGTVGILKKGRMWVLPEQAVVPGDPVYARFTAAAAPLDQLGALRKDDDTTPKAKVMPGGCSFESTAAAASPALVDVNIP